MDTPSSAGQERQRFRTGRANLGIAGRAARLLLLGEGLSRRAAAENQLNRHAGDRSTRKVSYKPDPGTVKLRYARMRDKERVECRP